VLIKKLHDENDEFKDNTSWMISHDEKLQELRQKYGKSQRKSGQRH
jgi:hypothetical protein